MDRLNILDGTGENAQGPSSYMRSPFLDITGTTSSPVSEVPPTLNLEARNYASVTAAPPARILLCFIDRKAGSQTAHYSLVPLPPSYEVSVRVVWLVLYSCING